MLYALAQSERADDYGPSSPRVSFCILSSKTSPLGVEEMEKPISLRPPRLSSTNALVPKEILILPRSNAENEKSEILNHFKRRSNKEHERWIWKSVLLAHPANRCLRCLVTAVIPCCC